jgi:hypothetical protein
MASEQLNPNLSNKKIDVLHAVQTWMGIETEHQLTAGFRDHEGSPATTRDTLLTKKVGAEWNRFRRVRAGYEAFPDETMRKLQIGQSALKTCVATQAAFVWNEVERGTDRGQAFGESLVLVDIEVAEIEAGRKQLPGYHLLDKPVNLAVNQYNGNPNSFRRPVKAYIGLFHLVTTALIEQTSDQRIPILPRPAVADGVLIPWSHK